MWNTVWDLWEDFTILARIVQKNEKDVNNKIMEIYCMGSQLLP